jgi:hypothetical protein
MRPPAVLLSPHLDDAVFSAWTMLVADRELTVVNVCSGVPAAGPAPRWDRVTGGRDAAEQARTRLAEDRDALALVGREALNLDFLDLQYRDGPLSHEAIAAALPPASELIAPAAIGAHPDHLAAREAALGSGLPVTLYAELPYAARFGWPHWVTGRDPHPHLVPEADWDHWLAPVRARGELVPRAQRLTEPQVAAKVAAMESYRSQFPAANGGPVGLLRNPEIVGFEVRFELSTDGRPARSATPRG